MKSILITSSILILLIAALRPILRGRIDPRMQYALWLVAALRLLAPVELAPSAYSALALLDRAEEPRRIVATIGQTAIPAQSYDSAHAQVIEEYRQQGVNTADLTPHDLMSIETQARERMKGPTLAEIAAKYAKPVWLTGAALMAAWFLLVNFRLRQKLRRAEPVEADCPLPVFVSGVLPSPCLCGTFQPKIYVTPGALTGSDHLRHVLAHELTHYRHRDHWWALVRCLCLCLYWFDPLVWWAAALSRQDCELACDAGAIRRLGEAERLSYGRTLVGMIAAGRSSLLQTATTMTGGKRRVKERVKLIARKPRTVIALALTLVLILGLAVGCTFTGAPEKKDPTPMNLPAETLQERLLDVPEELRASVKASASETKQAVNDIALVSYWWDVPAEWVSERNSWLLDVHRLEKEGIETYYDFLDGWSAYNDDCVADLIAQDEEFFYVVERPVDERFRMEDYEAFAAAYGAIREFAVQTVLDTEGVESYPSKPMDTLRGRLNSVPLELQGDVVTGNGHDNSPQLVSYWMNREWTNMDNSGLGFLLRVYTLTPKEYQEEFVNQANYGAECFASSDGTYYIIGSPTDARYYTIEDEPDYFRAYDAIRAYAMKTVLETEGVKPYTPRQPLTSLQARLMTVPEEWRDKVDNDANLYNDTAVLANYWLTDPKWKDLWSGYLLTLYRMDEARLQEELDRQLLPAVDIFARSGDEYFLITWPADGRYQDGDALSEEYWSAVNTMKDYVKATVLETEGIEPFDSYTTSPHFFSYAIDGMDYTLVNSYQQVPEDPEQWFLVGRLPEEPIWMFTRGNGEETMFQIDDHLTQVFPYRARFYGGGFTHDGRAPQIKRLEGGGNENGTYGTFAVITHVFQGGTDQLYQLTVYDLDTDPVTSYVHDWKTLMNDFNSKSQVQLHNDTHSATVSYQGQSVEIQFNEAEWENVQQYSFPAQTYEYFMAYSFNSDGTFNLEMPINPFTTPYIAVWTLRFTGSGFETTGFRFVQTDDAYLYISAPH